MVKRAIFLDRDGVINRTIVRDGMPYSPDSMAQLELTAGIEEVSRLKDRGFLLIVVTNQPNVSRGKQTEAEVEEIHRFLAERVPIDAFRICYHDDAANCSCRKPKPGLLTEVAGEYGIDLKSSYMVGDRWRDVEAGSAAGCRTVWIDYGYRERGPKAPPDARVANVREAIQWIEKDSDKRM
jgi:D-glycero-D-manno-heptose 1,7-bisphosphate phosphatase